jgi:hypothetical protein
MTLRIWELVSIVLCASVAGMFLGPWVALSKSFGLFPPETFLTIVHRMNRNMAPVMTLLMPSALLSIMPVLLISYGDRPRIFCPTLAGFAFFMIALFVTVFVEVPIVKQIETWTVSTLPGNWQHLRDRWGAFHIVRIIAGFAGLVLLLIGALF